MDESLLEKQISKIFSFSGIILMPTQRLTLENYIETKSAEKNVSCEEFCNMLTPGTEAFNSLINFVTVNETYFFREQRQFEFLEREVFPKFQGKQMNIWSAACSTGEEPLSLLALALKCGVNATVYATDIDDTAIAHFKRGVYKQNSFRPDGNSYHILLEQYGSWFGKDFTFNQEFIDRVKVRKFNLLSDKPTILADHMDLIFIRNVFIYFDKDTRKSIIESLCSVLKDESRLFFSMNEIGCMGGSLIPPYLHKKNYGMVYYFQRNDKEEIKKSDIIVERKKIETKTVQPAVTPKKTTVPVVKKVAPVPVATVPSADKNINIGNSEIKNIFEKVCEAINQSKYDQARALAEEISSSFKTKFYSLFLKGYTEYYAGDKKKADTLFTSVEMIKNDFWPVFFYHGLTLKDLGRKPEANQYFIRCQLVLDSYKEGKENPYDFIVDSFNPGYIYSLCRTLQRD